MDALLFYKEYIESICLDYCKHLNGKCCFLLSDSAFPCAVKLLNSIVLSII
uniref:Uncharacterized protein n=1 Tax=Anguilla anguilla TaxID=7936 RepID=A0A0E9SUH2_ANGAN